MSYGGFEYDKGGYGGMDVMSGEMGGGGFMGSYGDAGASTPKSTEKKASKDRQSLIPCTVKQLLSAEQDVSNDTYKVDNAELHVVRIMGTVEIVDEHATNVNYRVNDGTGAIECKYWMEKDSAASTGKQELCNPYSFVRVEGSLRVYEGKKHIFVYNIKVVDDFDEMTHHFLDVILTHNVHTRGPIPGSKAASATSASLTANQFSSPFTGSGMGMMPGMAAPIGRSLLNDTAGESTQQKILEVFKSKGQGPSGLSINDAMRYLEQDGISFDTVRQALEFFTNEGVLYTTIDEDHYKSTE